MSKKLKPSKVLSLVRSEAYEFARRMFQDIGKLNLDGREFIYKLQEIQMQCLKSIRESTSPKVIRCAAKTYDHARFYLVRDFDMNEELMYSRDEIAHFARVEIGLLHSTKHREAPAMADTCSTVEQLKSFIDNVMLKASHYLGFEALVLRSINQKNHEFGLAACSDGQTCSYNQLAVKLLAGSK